MKELEQQIYQHLKDRNWHHLKPGDIAKSIMIEGAELLELFQWDDPTLSKTKQNRELMIELKKELADVMIYAIEMSVLLGLDTETIILNKLEAAGKKYPAKMVKDAKAGSNAGSVYWRIKRAHRRK